MKIILTYIYLFLLATGYVFAAPPTAGSIDRSQEMIREDKALRRKIEQPEKFLVKKIVLKGNLKLSGQEAEGLIVPFQGQWLTKEDILQLTDSLKSAYQKKVIPSTRVNVFYELKKDSTLEITIKELTQ